MISIDHFGDILSTLAGELPAEFFKELNLGIRVDSFAKPHPQARGDLYILGEYSRSAMGQGIVIYYGSFARIFGDLSGDELTNGMRKTLRHEFRHHMEHRAGERGLEIEDERKLNEYLRGY